GGTFTYDGTAHAASAVAKGVGGASVAGTLTFSYAPGDSTTPVNAGTYTATATFASTDPNYANASGTGSLTLDKATPTVTVTGGTFTYDGTPHAASAGAKGVVGASVAGTFTFSYAPGDSTTPVNAGTYTATATFASTDPNYANTIALRAALPI